MRAMLNLGVIALAALAGAQELNTYRDVAQLYRLYDPDPDHLWNRLHRTLFERGQGYGLDSVDIYYWPRTKHLLEGPSHEAALAVLDEFLASDGEALVTQPIKRAFLQRDLWALFDWLVEPGLLHEEEAVLPLAQRLVRVMQSIALTEEAIAGLPDNYAQAVASGAFPTTPDLEREGAPYLPPQLLDENGPWVRIYGAGGDEGAVEHVYHTHGRNLFWVYIRLPEGRQATEDYVRSLRDFGRPYEAVDLDNLPEELVKRHRGRNDALGRTNIFESRELPQFPVGTEVALVRQMMLIDDTGKIVPTKITEEVQIRAYRRVERETPRSRAEFEARPRESATANFVLQLRKESFFNGNSGFVALDAESREHRTFRTHGFDPFEGRNNTRKADASGDRDPRTVVLESCTGCHQAPGVYSFLSRERIIGVPGRYMPQQGLSINNPEKWMKFSEQAQAAARWKTRQYDWGLMRGLWVSTRP